MRNGTGSRAGREQPANRLTRRRTGALVVAVVGVSASLAALSCRSGGQTGATSTTVPVLDPLMLSSAGTVTVPATMALPSDFRAPYTADVEVDAVEGRALAAPLPVTMTGGFSRLTGTVRGPDGPLPGATVRLERFLDDRSARRDVVADGNGGFDLGDLPGGRYRVRAWLPPALTMTRSELLFLKAELGHEHVDLNLVPRTRTELQTSISDPTSLLETAAVITATVRREYVDGDGIVRMGGMAGSEVSLSDPAGVIVPSGVLRTGPDGTARWIVVCDEAGSYSLTASSGDASQTVGLRCIDPTTTTTTTTAPPPAPLPGDLAGVSPPAAEETP